MINPWDAWMHGENWYPQFYTSDHTTDPRFIPPLHDCPRCQAQTTCETVCITCQHTALENVRRHVASGAWSDWREAHHGNAMRQGALASILETCGARVGWRASLYLILTAAEQHGFVFGGPNTTPEGDVPS
jgi:hypothetical protein